MQVLHEVCSGLDVHKRSVTACVLWATGRRRQTREFGTFTRELLELGDWLRSCGVTHVALESTGVYWKPVWNLLEGQFEVLLVNAQHIKAVPGRKTDQKDSEWIAELLQHGLLRASFVPPSPVRELRDLTRYRASLAQEINRIANRIQKVLEDANIKLASVATDTLGASGRTMLEAIVSGEKDSERLAEMAQGKLRNKIPQLQEALEGRVSAHHRFLLRELLDHHYFVESKMRRIEQEVEQRLGPFQSEVARLCTIPGVDRVTAWGLLAEIGWNRAGLCPGSHESAGKRKSGKIRKGSLWLRRCLCQAAWAVSTKRIITYRLCFADWQHGEGPNARRSPWRTISWSLLTTSCETAFAIATWDQITLTGSTLKDCGGASKSGWKAWVSKLLWSPWLKWLRKAFSKELNPVSSSFSTVETASIL